MSRPFYLIAHNPNTVDDAVASLAAGANALEPDVFYKDNEFYVNDAVPLWSSLFPPRKGPRLADYLTGLQDAIVKRKTDERPLYLVRIFFDTKNLEDYHVSLLYDLIRATFTLPGVAFSITSSTKKSFSSFNGFKLKAASDTIGVDGGFSAKETDQFFQQMRTNYTYANGNSVPLLSTLSTEYFTEIMTAIQLRDNGNKIKPTLVYAWTVNSKDSMRAYLSLGVDGFITDKIERALGVLAEPDFAGKFSLLTTNS